MGLKAHDYAFLKPLMLYSLHYKKPITLFWIQYGALFDDERTTQWVEENWPFAEVACPGRSIEWTAWDRL